MEAAALLEVAADKPAVRVLSAEEKSRGGHLCAEETECPFSNGVCCEGGLNCCKYKCVKGKNGKNMCQLDDLQKEERRRAEAARGGGRAD